MKKQPATIALLSMTLLTLAGCQTQGSLQIGSVHANVNSTPTTVANANTNSQPSQDNQNIAVTPIKTIESKTAKHKGDYFEITYPNDFTVSTVDGAYYANDEASFTSPDGLVEFFVYSPLWDGEPQDYLQVKSTEQMVDQKTEESGKDMSKKVVKWVTVKAKDGSYYRSWVSTKDQVGTGSDTHHVIGIKYKDDKAYKQYQDAYTKFKSSLTQFAD